MFQASFASCGRDVAALSRFNSSCRGESWGGGVRKNLRQRLRAVHHRSAFDLWPRNESLLKTGNHGAVTMLQSLCLGGLGTGRREIITIITRLPSVSGGC